MTRNVYHNYLYSFKPQLIFFQLWGWCQRNGSGAHAGKCGGLDLHGPLTRYAKLQVAHAPGMPGTFPPAADFEGNRYLAIPACITARAWRTCRDACRDRLPAVTGKTFPAFPAHAHPQFCVSGKRPIAPIKKCDASVSTKHTVGPTFQAKMSTASVKIML